MKRAHNTIPAVSVIMPVRNEQEHIRPCLDSLLANDYPKNQLELIITDGISTDASREVLDEYRSRYPFVKVIDNPRRIVPTGLNLAI